MTSSVGFFGPGSKIVNKTAHRGVYLRRKRGSTIQAVENLTDPSVQVLPSLGPKPDPEGPSTQDLRSLVPKSIPLMVVEANVLRSLVLEPSGFASAQRIPSLGPKVLWALWSQGEGAQSVREPSP